MADQEKRFDSAAFYAALAVTVGSRKATWKSVSQETGVSASTLTRMAQGRNPDAASLAVLSAWAGLNPVEFVDSKLPAVPAEPVALAASVFRKDPNLTSGAADAIETIMRSAYEALRTPRIDTAADG
jgi:hypothetical protein